MKAIALASVLLLGLASSTAKANTSIIQFGRPVCSDSTSREVAAAETLSKEWPVLTPSTKPSLFTVWPPADPASAEYWLKLYFDDGKRPASGPLDRFTGVLRSLASTRYAVRASHPANHPLDLGLEVYNAGEMLRAGGIAVEADDSSTPSSAHGEPGPCRVAYLHIRASRGKAVSIPRPSKDSRSSSWLMSLVERYYLGPLATAQPTDQPTPTPIHLTLDPLVFGVAPWSLTLGSPIFVPLLLVMVFVAGPAFARVLEKRIEDIAGAHAKKD